MMRLLQSFVLSICVLCTLAGLIHLFLPDNGFNSVINGILVLYILASVLKMAYSADWNSFARYFGTFDLANGTGYDDYTSYASDIAMQATTKSIESLLAENNVSAKIEIKNDNCRIILQHKEDEEKTHALLESVSGTLDYKIEVRGNGN